MSTNHNKGLETNIFHTHQTRKHHGPPAPGPAPRRERKPEPGPVHGWRQAVPVWTGRVIQTAGIWSVLGFVIRPLMPSVARAVAEVFYLLNLGGQPSLFNGAMLTLLGTMARLRKRVAVWATIIILMIWAPLQYVLTCAYTLIIGEDAFVDPPRVPGPTQSLASVVFDDPSFWRQTVCTLTAVATITLLVTARRAFPARLEKGTVWRALGILAAGVGLATALGFVLTYTVRSVHAPVIERLQWSLATAVGLRPQEIGAVIHLPGHLWFSLIVSLISALALLVASWQFTRAARLKRAIDADEELHIRKLLLTTPDADSLGYFATRRDKSVVFAPDGNAGIAYRVMNATALAAGDPLGDPDSWDQAIAAWRAHATTYGWVTAVLGTTKAGARAYERAGFRSLAIGDESVVQADDFRLSSPALRGVRAEVAHAQRAGYKVVVRRQQDIGAEELADLTRDVDAWRVGGPERGFSMASSRFGDPADGSCVIVVAYDAAGGPRGILSFVPWGRGGLSLDTMRRSPDAVNGVTEAMVTALIEAGPDLGIRRLSLNFAMFRRTFEDGAQVGASPLARLTRKLLLVASRWWQLESLYRSNEKYRPDWTPRLLCYERGAQLTQVFVAAGIAEGFLPSRAPRTAHRFTTAGRRAAKDGAQDSQGRGPQFVAQVRAQEEAAAWPPQTPRRINAQQRARLAKRDRFIAAGMPAYPVGVPHTMTIADLRASIVDGALAPGEHTVVSVAGRVMGKRDHGGLVFVDLRETSVQVQALIRRDGAVSAPGNFALATHLDLGDTISVTGTVVHTHTGDIAVDVSSWAMASKSLTPPPSKHHGITNPEARARQRHIDYATNATAQHMVFARAAAVRSIRESFYRRDFIEVETPMLQRIHGGANARPFRTHINAYGLDLYLRIAPELALKQLAIGGLERIFELGRNFRNEGADATHNPEFTSVEAYLAYADYTVMRELTREVITEAATAVHGRPVVRTPEGAELDISGPWPVVTVHDAVSKAVGTTITPDTGRDKVARIASDHDVHIAAAMTPGEIVAELYDALVEGATREPTFYIDFPVETSPLTRKHRRNPRLAERWDLVAFGAELGTAYSELIDPADQRERFTAQSLKAAAGDPEAMEIDEDFLSALEFGLPPTGGLGLGVYRIVMCIMGANIRETLAFPFVKPRT